MTRTKRLALALILATMALPAVGQSWDARTSANASLLFGYAVAPGESLGVGCTAPAPENAPLIDTGSHESHRTGAFEVYISFADNLFQWEPPYSIADATMHVGDTAYGLPPIELNELQGTAIYLPMEDPLILSLSTASSLIFDPGQGTAYAYPVEGIGQALHIALGHCVGRWSALGVAVPAQLERFRTESASAGGSGASTRYSPAPAFPVPAIAPPAAEAHISGLCDGPYDITDISRVQAADIDGDGAADYLLNWDVVFCQGGLQGRAFCGAANCSIDVFLSSRGYADPVQMLGIAADFVQDGAGRVGVLLDGTPFVCADGFCDTPWYWDGTTLAQ